MVNIVEETNYSDAHIALWQQAFGDSREDVLYFFNNAKNIKCLSLYDDGLCSMLFLVDCKISSEEYKYIYAACTDNFCRSRGYMSMLLSYARDNYSRLVLIPADLSLVNYYLKRKFSHKISIDNILFNECSEIEEYLFAGCSLNEPFALIYKGE